MVPTLTPTLDKEPIAVDGRLSVEPDPGAGGNMLNPVRNALARPLAAALGLTALLIGCAQTSVPAPTPQLFTVENVDSGSDGTRLVFNRIGALASPPAVGVHNRGTLRLHNTGTDTLHLSSLGVDGPWTVTSTPALPTDVTAGASVDVTLTFTAEATLTTPTTLFAGTLTINSDDPGASAFPVTLSGLWQPYPERDPNGQYTEPTLQQIHDAMGWTFALNTASDAAALSGVNNGSNVPINQRGWVHAQGDEVLSAYWQAADAAQPVTVQEVGAWSSSDASTLYRYARGTSTLVKVLTHSATDYQSLFPHADGSTTKFAQASFTPSGAFGFNMDGYEYSDPANNDQAKDRANGCPGPCGQHLRFWPLTAGGQVMPGAYVMGVDYQSMNDDYQDDLFIIRNITPATP
ncbi:hypothetical protein E7T09_16450 [Deinococcus sp. KSM4-11]|uniref:hypothetical protein n=1 Tax=Deinococcus sp. KSM4-11 TaxID=2568654 RepID=UPI0010A312FE|nr:hypothetical protein [Deinococcus sp. KSM4-11]THF85541.1 hypothetical protein E7T09_16450 [Deinococcus sp. KSM4-11]